MGRTFWIIVGSALVNRLGAMVGPFMPLYLLRERGLAEPAVASLLAAASLSAVAGAPIGGWLADRVGRRPCLVVGMALNGLAMLGIAHAPAGAALVALMCLRTFTNDVLRPATTAAIADVVPRERHKRAFGIYRTAINLGFGIGVFAGGLLAERSFLLLFFIDAAAKLIAAAALLALIPETRPASAAARPGRLEAAAPASRGPIGAFAAFCVCALLVSFMSSQLMASLPFSLERRGGEGVARLYGTLLALNGLLVTLAQLPISLLTERLRVTTGLALGALLYGLGYGLVALPATTTNLAAAIALVTVGEMLFFPLASVLTAQLAPEATRGRWFGAMVMAFGAGSVLSPLVGAWVMRERGDQALWLLSPPLGLAVAMALLWLGRRRDIVARQGGEA